MLSPSKKVFFADHVFDVWENVYEPAEDSFLFADNLTTKHGDHVLDMGTGCGILGIIAAKEATRVAAVDINPYAVRCAKENARLNHLANKMLFMQGNLFTPLRTEERFDLILFNAPYLPVDREQDDSWLECAWAGGATGRSIIDLFIHESRKHLQKDGRIFLMQSTLCGIDETMLRFKENGLETEIVAERSLPFFERIVLLKSIARSFKSQIDVVQNLHR